MIYPSIAELTNNNKINRYTLVVATAKCARIITDEYVKHREYAERLSLSKDSDKKNSIASMIKREYRDEKAVKTAISGLYNGEFKIIEPDGTVEMIGRGAELVSEAEAQKSVSEADNCTEASDPVKDEQ